MVGGNLTHALPAVAGHGLHSCHAAMERKTVVGMAHAEGTGQGGNREPAAGTAQPHRDRRHLHP